MTQPVCAVLSGFFSFLGVFFLTEGYHLTGAIEIGVAVFFAIAAIATSRNYTVVVSVKAEEEGV